MEQNKTELFNDVVNESPVAEDELKEPVVQTTNDNEVVAAHNKQTDDSASDDPDQECAAETTDIEASSETEHDIVPVNDNSSTSMCDEQPFDTSKIEKELVALKNRFERKIAVDEHKNALFDKMYDELQTYKTDIYAKILKPFVIRTITLINDINIFLSRLGENKSPEAENFLREIPDDLIDILDMAGVDIYEEESDVFNPRTQKAIKIIPTDNPDLDKHIACRIQKGYSWQNSILRLELIHLYKYVDNK